MPCIIKYNSKFLFPLLTRNQRYQTVSKHVSSDIYDEEYHQAYLFQVQIFGITLIKNKIKTNEQSYLLELKSSRNFMVVFILSQNMLFLL